MACKTPKTPKPTNTYKCGGKVKKSPKKTK